MEKETKEIYYILIITASIFFLIGLYLGWLDNGPRLFF
jgi:hypothetical protein